MRNLETRNNRSISPFEDFDQIFDSFFAPIARQSTNFVPPYELEENEQGYLLSFDIPGVPKDEIKIEVKDQQLRVYGERRKEERKDEGTRTWTERRYGRFERSFTLPADVNTEKVQAHHQDGVLHLMLPKAERVQARTINIESGPTGFFSKLVGKKDESKVN